MALPSISLVKMPPILQEHHSLTFASIRDSVLDPEQVIFCRGLKTHSYPRGVFNFMCIAHRSPE